MSDKVDNSDTILEVEVPAIVNREREDPNFDFVIALCPDLNSNQSQSSTSVLNRLRSTLNRSSKDKESMTIYEKASYILNESSVQGDPFSTRNMEKIKGNGHQPSHSDSVAEAVLENRLNHIKENTSNGDKIYFSLDSYDKTHPEKPDIKIDWKHRFEDGLPSEEVWNERLVPVLESTLSVTQDIVPGRVLNFRGNAHLSAAFTLGALV